MNAFEVFGLQADTNIDLSALASRYRDLQSAVHPDRFANATDVEQRIALVVVARSPIERLLPYR